MGPDLNINIEELRVGTKEEKSPKPRFEKLRHPLAWLSRKALKLELAKCLSALHWSGIHGIRRFCVNRHLLGKPGLEDIDEPFLALANSCRDAMATIIDFDLNNLYCTIKRCEGAKDNAVAWTIARSDPFIGQREFGPDYSHRVAENSCFAALLGTRDTRNTWDPHVYSSFTCDNLTKHNNYVDSFTNWREHLKSTMVFPLRYIRGRNSNMQIRGFLTFYANSPYVFRVPCIFDYVRKPDDYQRELSRCSAYHVGGVLADTIAIAIALQDPEKEDEITNEESENE